MINVGTATFGVDVNLFGLVSGLVAGDSCSAWLVQLPRDESEVVLVG